MTKSTNAESSAAAPNLPLGEAGVATDELRRDISLIAEDIGPDKVSLYLGGLYVANDLALLRRHGITTVVNCAINLDINYVEEGQYDTDRDSLVTGRGPVRTYKIGIVDGPGNSDGMIAAGYLLLQGALNQVWPETSSYPVRERGNVLVHCRGGRSRSVIIAAMYLHLDHQDRFATLDHAIAEVRKRRELDPGEYHEAPKTVLVEAARRVIENLGRAQWRADPAR